jgi:hypothetical protein
MSHIPLFYHYRFSSNLSATNAGFTSCYNRGAFIRLFDLQFFLNLVLFNVHQVGATGVSPEIKASYLFVKEERRFTFVGLYRALPFLIHFLFCIYTQNKQINAKS